MIKCPACHHIAMRLLRYQGEREIWACQDCGEESMLLDCHLCERRGVRRAGQTDQQVEWWACHRCEVPQYRCPACGKGWLHPGDSGEWTCGHCHAGRAGVGEISR